jgi:hypothetical protein
MRAENAIRATASASRAWMVIALPRPTIKGSRR